MKLSDQQFEFARDCVLLEQWMINHGYKFTYGEAWRPDEMQKIYYERGLSQIEGRGPHGNRLARDYNIWVNGVLTYVKEDLKPIGEFWESLNPLNRWGGELIIGYDEDNKPKYDTDHFERRKLS